MSPFNSRIFCFNPSYDEENTIRDKTIFHYTSPDAMISILKNESIRFTDCQFLNDRTEYNHILEPLDLAISQVKSTISNNVIIDTILRRLERDFQHLDINYKQRSDGRFKLKTTLSRYYVFCASRDSDSLNMWNYYIKNGSYQGYSIGLSVNKILEMIPSSIIDQVMFGEVIYDNKLKTKLLIELLQEADDDLNIAIDEANSADDPDFALDEAVDNVVWGVLNKIDNYRLFFKNSAFEGEKEFRIAIKLPQTDRDLSTEGIKKGYTSKHGVISPHFDLKISNESIRRITLSPMLESELASTGLNRLIRDQNYSHKIEIQNSIIPVRY